MCVRVRDSGQSSFIICLFSAFLFNIGRVCHFQIYNYGHASITVGARHTQPLNMYSYWSIASLPGSPAQLFSHAYFTTCEKRWEVEPGNEANLSTHREASVRVSLIVTYRMDILVTLAGTYPMLLDCADGKQHE